MTTHVTQEEESDKGMATSTTLIKIMTFTALLILLAYIYTWVMY